MPPQVEEKTMIPTVIVGVGGTGAEVIARVRRLVEETYSSLDSFPILGFLLVDTDKGYQITNPEAGGSPLKDNEKYWAKVSGKEVQEMVRNMENYPWINRWFPNELEKNIGALEAGAGQIRACGRFALFCNYKEIESKFLSIVSSLKGKENLMLDRYNIKVSTNAINVFVTGSLSGGTGSGMLIDMGYCVRKWLEGEGSSLVTAIVPMPQAFSGISVGSRVLANGYAAMMELSYFSDDRTEYINRFSSSAIDEIRNDSPPFDFTYLVGTKNGENDFKLEQIREMIAQNIFLDLTSDFAPHKRSIRDNIKSSWAEKDPGGKGYSKQFMSFGLSAIEIPMSHIRASLSARLGEDLVKWWLNEDAILPGEMMELVKGDLLKKMHLTEVEMLANLGSAGDRPYYAVISQWINNIRQEIEKDNLLECSQQGVNMLGAEKGKILRFIDGYLQPKVDDYRADHFRESSTDERLHGDYFKKIYSNRDGIIQSGCKALESELYRILADRTQGAKFADAFIVIVRQVFSDAEEKFRREQDQVWAKNEQNRQKQYEAALKEINEFKDKFGISKKERMEQFTEEALQGLEASLIATIQRKIRSAGLDVIKRLQEYLTTLENRLNRWKQKLITTRDLFREQAAKQSDSADALIINGIKLYDRQELNQLYQDMIEQLAGGTIGNKSLYQTGIDSICSTMSEDILKEASPLWKETRQANEIMSLFDITVIPDVQEEDFRKIISNRSQKVIKDAPNSSQLKRELAACDRLFKMFNDQNDIVNNLRIAYNKSKPLVILNRAVLQGEDAGFTPQINRNVAILGGERSGNPAAQKMLPLLSEFLRHDDIKPLGDTERHRIVFVQEIGGFSLRCIDGMKQLREAYQDWRSQFILAKRAQQQGKSKDLPIPVHIEKNPPFWDIFPEDEQIFELVIQARALKVLFESINQATKEKIIRYHITDVTGQKNIDLASNWEEVTQVLEIKACATDKEEIKRQVSAELNNLNSEQEKWNLYQQLLDYLTERALEFNGGKDSPQYKREDAIIGSLIKQYKLNLALNQSVDIVPNNIHQNENITAELIEPEITEQQKAISASIFCSDCGAKNASTAKFCSNCGHKLT